MKNYIKPSEIKKIVPREYHRYSGIGDYLTPLWGYIFRKRLSIALSLYYHNKHYVDDKSGVIGDMGSGFGIFVAQLGYQFSKSKIIGLDIYPANILKIAKNVSEFMNAYNTSSICGDMSRLPFANAKLDALFALDSLEHVPGSIQDLCELKRILKPNGVLIISVPLETMMLRFVRYLYAFVKPIEINPHWRGTIKSFSAFQKHLSSIFKVKDKVLFPLYNFLESI